MSRISKLTLIVFVTCAGCTPHVPVVPPSPPAPPINPVTPIAPSWGHVTKTTNCVAVDGLPDAACSPGNINAALTKDLICAAGFRTADYRDKVTTPEKKATTYALYNITRPPNNTGANQQCELDHLIPLEIGGADDLSNIWPQCSPGYAGWTASGFRDKDKFENYLHRMVCAGSLSLTDAQLQISSDWLRYWTAAGKPTQ